MCIAFMPCLPDLQGHFARVDFTGTSLVAIDNKWNMRGEIAPFDSDGSELSPGLASVVRLSAFNLHNTPELLG